MYYSAASGFSAIASVISSLFSWAAMACQLIGSWFTFKKMGLPGWKGIIPYYSHYVLFDELWEKKMFWRYVVYYAIMTVLTFIFIMFIIITGGIGAFSDNRTVQTTAFFALIIGICIYSAAAITLIVLTLELLFRLYKRLAASFGKSTGFAVGLLFLYPVFIMILGFDKSEYIPAAYQNPNQNNYRPPYQNNYQ